MPRNWLFADDIIEIISALIAKDGTTAIPYEGRAHLYSGPRDEIHDDGKNILNYVHKVNGNYARAKFLAPIFNARLIDDMNVYKVLNNVDGSGLDIYSYFEKAYGFDKKLSDSEADRVSRYVSGRFIDDIYGSVTTSVCGAGRNRVFFDTELPCLARSREVVDLVAGLAKSKEIETVNDGTIIEIRNLFKLNAIELAFRVICVNEQDKLSRTAWDLASKEIMKHCLDVEEFYMIDRKKGWKTASEEIFSGQAGVSELIRLDGKLNAEDQIKGRSLTSCGTPTQRLSHKEWKLFCFVVDVMAKKSLPSSGIAIGPG